MDVYSWFRRVKTSLPSPTETQNKKNNTFSQEEEGTIYGITPQLLEFVSSLTLDTFRNFHLPDEEEGDNGGQQAGGNLRKDLSDWQERHASLVLTKAKELSQLRFRLSPRYMKEQKFWRIYFALVKNYVAEYELRAIRLEKLKLMKMENGTSSNINAYEVEMSETKQAYNAESADSFDHNSDNQLII